MGKNLDEKFKNAHLEDQELKKLIHSVDDLDIDDTLSLLLDSELLVLEDTTYFKLNEDLNGQFSLGIEPRSRKEVKLSQNQLGHGLILGKTQYGKSTLIALLCKEMLDEDISFWVFEPKQDQRHLIRENPELQVIRLDEIKINPFAPPVSSFSLRRWWQVVWEVLTQEQELLSGSKAMGYELLEELLDKYSSAGNPTSNNSAKYPTIRQFLHLVEKALAIQKGYGPRRTYLERLKTRLVSLLFSFGEVLDCQKGWPIEELKDGPIVFEYEGIDTSAARFIVLTLLYKLFFYHQATGERTKSDYHFLIFDEGEKIFSPYLEGKATGNPFLNELVNFSKEFGIGFIVANQTPKLTSAIKDNATTYITFNIDGGYVKEVSSHLGLDQEQEQALMELDVGSAVVRTSGSFTRPFLVNIPHFKLVKEVTDREVREHSGPFVQTLMEGVVSVKEASKEDTGEGEAGKPESKKKEAKLGLEEGVLLTHVAQHPYLSVNDRMQALNWSGSKFSRIRKKLRDNGYLVQRRLRKGGRGGTSKLLDTTQLGKKYLTGKGVTLTKRRGGIIHSYWEDRLCKHLKNRDYDVRKEVKLDLMYVDILATHQSGQVTAYEIETSDPNNTLDKLEHLLSKVDSVVICVSKKVLIRKLEDEIGDDIKEDLKIRKLQDMDLDPLL